MFGRYLHRLILCTLGVLSGCSAAVPCAGAQDSVSSPGDIILQALRAAERQDSTIVANWRRATAAYHSPSGVPGSVDARLAALGLAATAWVTYRPEEAREWLARLTDDSTAHDLVTPFAWILRGEVAASLARLLPADSAFAWAVELSRELGVDRAQAWGLIRLANVRGRITGDPSTSADLLARAEPLLGSDDGYLRGQFHCVRAGNDPTGAWTAEADARAGLAFAEESGIRRLSAACMHVLGSDQLRRGRTDEALSTFWEEQEVQRAIGDRAGRAATLQWAGYLLFTSGDYATAKAYLLEAVREGEGSGNLSPVAWAYMSLSGISVGLGDLTGGIEYLDRAERLLEAQGDQWGLATLRGRRASVAFAAGDRDTAREIWEETLSDHLQARNVVGVLTTQTGLLEIALASGELDRAEALLEGALQTARTAGMGAWEISLSFHEAEIALKRGDGTRARLALDRFLQPGQFSVRIYRAQARYAEALVLEGRIAEAASRLASSLDALEEWRSGLDVVGLEQYAFQIGEYLPDPDLGVASVLAAMARNGMVSEAFTLAERQRARNLYESLILAEIGRNRDVTEPGDHAPIPPASSPLDAAGVMAAVPDAHSAIVEFVTGQGGEPTTAFALTRDAIEVAGLLPVDSLARDIELLRSLVESDGEYRPVASRLGGRLLDPVLAHLPPGVTRLIVVPSGHLHRVPFDLLETSRGGPLMEHVVVSLAPSASVLARLRQSSTEPPPGFLVIGAPALSENDSVLPPLPGAARESRLVAGFGDPSRVLTGEDASEDYLKRTPLEGIGVLHFATHVVVDESSPAGTRLVLAPGGGEDGLVSPGDIAHLRLSAPLVVLSACRTVGGTVVRGEGVQGLTAPFLEAGARTVLATQWIVEDRAGFVLLREFYGRMAEGAPAGEALLDAKISARARGEPARVWAAFTVVGDPDIRVPAVSPAWWYLVWSSAGAFSPSLPFLMALAIIVGMGGMGFVRRKSKGR